MPEIQQVCVGVSQAVQGQQVGNCVRQDSIANHPNLQNAQLAPGYSINGGALGYMLIGPPPQNLVIAPAPLNLQQPVRDPQTGQIVFQPAPSVVQGIVSIANPLVQAAATILNTRAQLNQPQFPQGGFLPPPPPRKSSLPIILLSLGVVGVIAYFVLSDKKETSSSDSP